MFAESPNRIWLANRGELKLPDKVPNNFPGNWGFFNVQAAVVPIASMTNTVVLVDGDGKLIESWNQWDKLYEWGRGPHRDLHQPLRSGETRVGGRRHAPRDRQVHA